MIRNIVELVQICLLSALHVHDQIGRKGSEVVRTNRFGEKALRVDVEIEEVIIACLREAQFPIRVISEEHGTVDIMPKPQFLGRLDGLDGSGVYKKSLGMGRYGTMFDIALGLDPQYGEYIAGGIMEHGAQRLYLYENGKGAYLVSRNGDKTRLRSAGNMKLQDACMYADIVWKWELPPHKYSHKLDAVGIPYGMIGSSAIAYADIATGEAHINVEYTRKDNLEIAVAYGLLQEAGAVLVDGTTGQDIGEQKYAEFGQTVHVPLIAAANYVLAHEVFELMK